MNNPIKLNKPIIWTISGSDCSGGAGIAADIKTGHSIGVDVCHLITANTVQNSQQLLSVNPISCDILSEQVNALLADKPPAVIKIGLLATSEQITWLIDTLASIRQANPQVKTVFDPVGSASVGGKFSDFTLNELLALFSHIDVLTPNLLEARQLATLSDNPAIHHDETSIDTNVVQLANAIVSLGVKSVIIKGGHIDELSPEPEKLATDYCLNNFDTQLATAMKHSPIAKQAVSYQLTSLMLATSYSHGGGCSFASAIASYLAQGYLLRDAFTLTKAFIQQGLAANLCKQDYYGAFEQVATKNKVFGHHFPTVVDKVNQHYQSLGGFKSLALTHKENSEIKRDGSQSLGLYPVVDNLEWLERLLPLNLNIIQLRIKNIDDAEQLDQIIGQAVALYKNSTTRLFINDYWQLAIKHRAYGVHIGQEDLQDADLAAIQQAGLRLGVSTHGCYEFLLAQQLKPSYLAIGAIFPTNTKDMTGQIQGIDNLRSILSLSTDIPIVAIGGINQQRAAEVWQTGVDSLAVVTAITRADDAELATRELQAVCRSI